ncbi:hypothetical protein [Thiolapillus brandeum]|uniref:Uncharacterized protein n=1 Tax=Thiolapillus brandeum TaxID=1076588 RepID=A0A7U6GIE5_9GAMM|nr:hypothetical protein [Thiolapillus brandeum]BAO44173.1 hypothetical protein TBH_C1248 [Thiolapillus brandeum]
MYENSETSTIGKELTRAFIKNCISQTTSDLLKSVNDKVDKKHINTKYISNLNNFYREVFSIKNIIKNMRTPVRKKLFRHYKESKNRNLLSELKALNTSSKDSLSVLFEQHGLSGFKPLVGLTSDFDNEDGIHGFEIFALFLSRMRAKGEFKKELRRVTKGD